MVSVVVGLIEGILEGDMLLKIPPMRTIDVALIVDQFSRLR
jgi:hypothetical protein